MSVESNIRKELIIRYIREKGTASFSEICAYMKATSVSFPAGVPTFNKSTIAGHLQHLIYKGIIERASRATYKLKEHAQDESKGWGKPIIKDSENALTGVETPKEDTLAPEPTPEPSVSEQAQTDAYN